MTTRYQDALLISDGACNPSGICHAIIEACEEIRAEGQGTPQICADPAIKLMVDQLGYLMGRASADYEFWATWRHECAIRAA